MSLVFWKVFGFQQQLMLYPLDSKGQNIKTDGVFCINLALRKKNKKQTNHNQRTFNRDLQFFNCIS